ncbi:uncharacterized protein LOC108629986 [Ceratina calcarata]|uniref:Uncharacterized protein LOC108629986 n=1 Tax=Ceratina calcarata TaxID=156304 RepID=A0AAJ7JB03_9HYME|nr:uncharacterized protein LOC108629986 [Ceratina calcarata]XP_026673531.1 uncharacterized protein LOC108629986 [Ceratina calcarata]XP_026673532.1 uncharacterized protein LOC108629986 [Ceratina calcarata]XP_026673533.1 uncharacterized protein LOC108629986 [Ceratina calcarata]
MDEHNNDPYEQQLYAVFQSCLMKGETELRNDDWLNLCRKLHLTEYSEELKSCIQQHAQEKQSISFQEFRTALLTLLGKTQGSVTSTQEDAITELQNDISPSIIDRKCDTLVPNNSSSNVDFVNIKTGIVVDESRLKCLWEKINPYLKENIDSATMVFISNCLGIPALPKQITQSIFEKLDKNCDGLISLEEFLVIFQNETMEDQLTLDRHNEFMSQLTKLDSKKRNFDVHTSRKSSFTRNNAFLDTCKLSKITNTSLLIDGTLKTSEISLADLTITLCDELKNFNHSLDQSTIRSHIMLRDVLMLYQEELHNLNLLIENLKGEKEKLRTDIVEANERANTLAQEIEEQQARQEKIVQNVRKQVEQRHSEMIQDLSNQLNSERETNATALKSKDDKIQLLQKENQEIRNKFITTLQEYQVLESENEVLCSQIEKLKQSNNELITQIKMLAAEHDESENVESNHQQEIVFLVERIKRLQSEAVLLRDQNDELTAELESLKLHDSYTKDTRELEFSSGRTASHTTSVQSNEIENGESFIVEEEDDLDVVLKHSTSLPYNTNEEDSEENCRTANLKQFKDMVMKQLKNILTYSNKCTSESCVFKMEISGMLTRLQLSLRSLKEVDFVKSIASEMEAECEERTSESLRDFVVSKHKNSVSTKRGTVASISNDTNSDVDNFSNQDAKTSSPNKVSSLRDYPPRKEEHTSIDWKSNKEKDTSVLHYAKSPNETNAMSNLNLSTADSSEDVFLSSKLKDLEATHAAEKKQLIEQCAELERSLELLKIEYEECEDYWTAKLEEERQLFEQEQKISDEKFSELITKMAEYEELFSPVDKIKNGGRLSPIEEKFNLEQQYLDLEEEFEKCKLEMREEICQKDKEIKDLEDKIKKLERPLTSDSCVQVTDEFNFSSLLTQSNMDNSINCQPSSESVSKLTQCNDSIRKLPQEYKFDRILESSNMSDGLMPRLTADDVDSRKCDICEMHAQHSEKNVNNDNTGKVEPQWNTTDINGKLMHEKSIHNGDYDFVQNTFKLQNLRAINCQCVRNDAQVCCININILHHLNMKLQAQERKKQELQKLFKQQRYHTEHVLQHILSQHQAEILELQCLLRNTQKRLQLEYQANVVKAEQLARTDILVKDLYIENACLTANLKRLQQNYHMLTGVNAESTSI